MNKDRVNHPSHYTWLKEKCGIEVIDITRELDNDTGCAVKYLLRCGHKTEEGYTEKQKTIEDLRKAIWYINDKIKMLERESSLPKKEIKNNSNIIKLTSTMDTPIYINKNNIISYKRDACKNFTVVSLTGSMEYVIETPETINKLLE